MKYKAGDLVRCVDNKRQEYQLTEGKTYKVLDCTYGWVYIDCSMTGGLNPNRFELVKEEVSMQKFKVGDVVKVTGSEDDSHKKWNGVEGFNNTWARVMDNFIGKVCKVTSITEYGITLTGCGGYRFSPQALELYNEEMKIQKDKKYRTVEGKHPVGIVYTEALGAQRYVILCEIAGTEWVAQVNEYGEHLGCRVIEEVPESDWSKVEVDAPIWIGNLNGEYEPRHFAEFKNDCVYFYGAGRSSHTSIGVTGVFKSSAALTNPNEKA